MSSTPPSRRAVLRLIPPLALAGLAARPGLAQVDVPLRVGFISIMPMTQLFVIEGERWARNSGLDLILKRFSSGPPMVDALAAGDLDVAYIGIGPAMVARTRGIDVKVVAANVVEQVALIGRGALVGAFEAAATPAEAFRKFREQNGRPARIATLPPGAVPDTVLRYYLRDVGKLDGLIDILGVGEDEVQRLLLAGVVDAASIVEPILTIAREHDRSARILAKPSQMLPNHPGAVVLVRRSVIRDNRKAVAQLVTLHVRATAFVRADLDRATTDVVEFLGRGLSEPAVVRKALTSDATNLIADPHLIVEPTRVLQAFQRSLGAQPASIDVDALFDFSFYDAVAPRR